MSNTFVTPMDCSLPGSSVRGILQARILEWVAVSSPEDLRDSGIETESPVLTGKFFTTGPPGKPISVMRGGVFSGCLDNIHVLQGVGSRR